MTVPDHVYLFQKFVWLTNTEPDFGNLHLKSMDAGRSMKSDLINGHTSNAWPRGIWIGWPPKTKETS